VPTTPSSGAGSSIAQSDGSAEARKRDAIVVEPRARGPSASSSASQSGALTTSVVTTSGSGSKAAPTCQREAVSSGAPSRRSSGSRLTQRSPKSHRVTDAPREGGACARGQSSTGPGSIYSGATSPPEHLQPPPELVSRGGHRRASQGTSASSTRTSATRPSSEVARCSSRSSGRAQEPRRRRPRPTKPRQEPSRSRSEAGRSRVLRRRR
jgi:hypothetical protein